MALGYHTPGGKVHARGWHSYNKDNSVRVYSGYCGANVYQDSKEVLIEDIPAYGRCKVCWRGTKYDPTKGDK